MAKNPKKPSPTDIHVGNRIRLRRTMLGMSQTSLGQRVGITFQQIQKYEKGLNRVSSSRLKEIATVFGCPIAYFFEEAPDNLPNGDGRASELQAELSTFIDTKMGIELNREFIRINNPKVRRKIVALVEALANTETEQLLELLTAHASFEWQESSKLVSKAVATRRKSFGYDTLNDHDLEARLRAFASEGHFEIDDDSLPYGEYQIRLSRAVAA